MASPRTLSLAAIPSCPVKGRRSASSYPSAPGSHPGCPRPQPEASKKMRLSDFCNRLHLTSTPRTARFPAACLARHASRRVTPRCAAHRTRRLALGHGPGGDEVGCPDAACQTSQPGGASLDGEPPASASAATRYLDPLGASGVGAPDGFLDQVHQTQRSPGGAAIDSPSAPNLPVRAFSAANRACDEASDVPFHDPGWTHLDRRP